MMISRHSHIADGLPLRFAQLVSLLTYDPEVQEVLPGAEISTEISMSPDQMDQVIKTNRNTK